MGVEPRDGTGRVTWLSPAPERDRFVDDLLGHMTLGEKIGQLNLCHDAAAPGIEAAIAQGLVGGVTGATDPERLQQVAIGQSRLGIPLFLFDPAIHGVLSPWALAASWDEELARLAGASAAETALKRGFNIFAGPCVGAPAGAGVTKPTHIATEEPWLAARLSGAFLAGAADREAFGSAQALPVASWTEGSAKAEQAWATQLLTGSQPTAVDSGAIDRPTALRAGFDGLLVAECRALHAQVEERFRTTSTRSMLEAGERAIADGSLSEHRIDATVRAVLGAKHALGLFHQPERLVTAGNGSGMSLPVAAAMRRKAMVLLRNEAGLLPLSPVSDRVLVVGPTDGPAASCADALTKCSISFSAAPGLAVRKPGESWRDAHPGDSLALSLTRDAAKRADFVLAVLDERHFAPVAGARFPRPTPTTLALLRALGSARTRVAAMVIGPNPVDLAEADPYFAAVLQCWEGGAGFEEALGDILSGRHAPQGRLPVAVGRYAFGQGGGYGESAFTGLRVAVTAAGVIASLRIRNTGSFALRETAQLYVSGPQAEAARLVDFVDVTLAPGEETAVTFALEERHLSLGSQGPAEIAPGRYIVAVGKDRGRVLSAEVEITPSLARTMAARGAAHLRLAAG